MNYDSQKRWKGRNKERVKATLKRWREKHKEYTKAYNKNYQKQVRKRSIERKITVMTHYGDGKCRCVVCGESRLACLSIDHIEGGGTKHRKALRLSAGDFYSWLKANNYPKGYQTLCMNCQFCKKYSEREWGLKESEG